MAEKKKKTALELYKEKRAAEEASKSKTPTSDNADTPIEKEPRKKKGTSKKKATSSKKESAKKKPTTTKKKAIKEEVQRDKTASTSSLVDKLRGKLDNLKGGDAGGQRFNYIKFERGKNFFRLVEPTSGPLMILYKRHRGNMRGRFRGVVDLNWLFGDNDCLEAMLERKKLTERDLELVSRYGDPYQILFDHLNSIGRAETFKNARIGQKRSMMIIHMDGEFGVLDMGMTFGENLIDLLDTNPSIVSWEEGMPLMVKATGEGMKRRYSQPVPLMNESGPLELDEEDDEPSTPNLYDVIASNVMNYPDKVQFLLSSHRKLVDIAAMDVEDFGISEDELSTSFNYGENKKPKRNRRIKEVEEEEEPEDLDEDEEEEEDLEEEEGDLEEEDEDLDEEDEDE